MAILWALFNGSSWVDIAPPGTGIGTGLGSGLGSGRGIGEPTAELRSKPQVARNLIRILRVLQRDASGGMYAKERRLAINKRNERSREKGSNGREMKFANKREMENLMT